MGYSHYFNNMELSRREFLHFSDQCSRIINVAKEQGIPVKYDSYDDAEPLLRNDEVMFNGIEKEGHETFILKADPNSDFCKTLEKPYDDVVTACLLAWKVMFRTKVEVRTDGTKDNWTAGFDLFEKAIGMKAKIDLVDNTNQGMCKLINTDKK